MYIDPYIYVYDDWWMFLVWHAHIFGWSPRVAAQWPTLALSSTRRARQCCKATGPKYTRSMGETGPNGMTDIEKDQERPLFTGKDTMMIQGDIHVWSLQLCFSNIHAGDLRQLDGFLVFVQLKQPKEIRRIYEFFRDWIVDQCSTWNHGIERICLFISVQTPLSFHSVNQGW